MVLIHRQQLEAMLKEELDQKEADGDHLVFDSSPKMHTALVGAMESAIMNSQPVVVDEDPFQEYRGPRDE